MFKAKSLIFENDSIAIYDTYISLNSKENISPTIYKNGILYASENKLGFYKLYFSDLENDSQKIKVNSKFHAGKVSVYKNEIYFTKSIKGLKPAISNVYDLAIFKGTLVNNKISKDKPLSIYKKGFVWEGKSYPTMPLVRISGCLGLVGAHLRAMRGR